METTPLNDNVSPSKESAGIFSDLSIADFFNLLRLKWVWILLSVAICVGIGTLYVLRAPRIYTGNATVLVKDPYYGKGSAGIDLSDLGVVSGRSNLDNEIATFTSIDLLMRVCSTLDLDNKYMLKSGMRNTELFQSSPVTVSFPDDLPDGDSFGFSFVAGKNGDVVLSDFYKATEDGVAEYDNEVRGRIGTRVKTPVGVITLTRSSWPGSEKNFGKKIKFSHSDLRKAANALFSNLNVKSSSRDGTTLDLAVKASSPDKAEAILNAIIDEYNNTWLEDKNAVAAATTNFINKRLGVIEKELGNVDSDISSYKANNLTPDVGESSRLILQQSEQLQNRIVEISNQISIAEFIRAELGRDNITEPLPTNIGLENSGVEDQITKYNELVLQRNRLLTSVGERNPLSIEKGEALRVMRANILRSSGNLVSSLRTQLRGLQSQDSRYDSRLASSPGQARYLLSAERKQKVQETLYLFLLQKREENEIGQSFTTYNIQIIDSPYSSGVPVSPRTRLVLIVCFVIGLAIPAAIIYLLMALSNKIHTRSDIESLTVPFMGEIPQDGGMGHKYLPGKLFRRRSYTDDSSVAREIVVKHGSNNIVNEAFRLLRTNLEFVGGDHEGGLVLMLTSSYPGSGKTFISTNLGAVLAVKKHRTLIVDADLRKGTLSRLVHSPREGLSQVLAKGTDVESVIVRNVDKIENLDMLPAGTLPPNPSELIGSKRFGELVAKLRTMYDYVIFDCPPVEMVADSQIVSRFTDITLFVMRAGLFDKRLLPTIQKYYDTSKFNNLAVVINGTESNGVYGYRSYGRYGYRSYGRYGYNSYSKE